MLSAQQNNSFYQIGFLVIAVFLIIYAPACTAKEEPTKAHTVTPVSSPADTKSMPAKPLVPTKIPTFFYFTFVQYQGCVQAIG